MPCTHMAEMDFVELKQSIGTLSSCAQEHRNAEISALSEEKGISGDCDDWVFAVHVAKGKLHLQKRNL